MTVTNSSSRNIFLATLLCATLWSAHSAAGPSNEVVKYATLGRAYVQSPVPLVQDAGDDTLTCFSGEDAVLVNPGCFATSDPSQPGDCSATSSQYLVQYLFPDNATIKQVRGFSFVSNDAVTVFPAAGALLIPIVDGNVRFPTTGELASLQRTNLSASEDLGEVFVDLRAEQILVGPDTNAALVLVLQFPNGQLVGQNDGPAIVVEATTPDGDCDFFTIDGGSSGTWFAPVYDPGNPNSLPLDWGFLALFDPPAVAIEDLTWSAVKKLYDSAP